ncbi:unnamed protein product, partial [Rotaria sp. Silwood2]
NDGRKIFDWNVGIISVDETDDDTFRTTESFNFSFSTTIGLLVVTVANELLNKLDICGRRNCSDDIICCLDSDLIMAEGADQTSTISSSMNYDVNEQYLANLIEMGIDQEVARKVLFLKYLLKYDLQFVF